MKDNTNITITDIEQYAQTLKNRIAQLEFKLKSLPDGTLTYTRKNGYLQYYYRAGGGARPKYIPVKNETQINTLANKYYIHKVLPKLKKNLRAAEKFIATHSGTEEHVLFESMPEQLQLRNSNLFVCKQKYIDEWQNRTYNRNTYKPESIIHDTIRGEKVRSKSEAMIANAVFNYKLAYFVERPLRLKNKQIIYPDFTILNPNTLEEVYWEHFGMMDSPEYANDAVRRIQLLDNEGIKLGKNLICTFESSIAPLSSAMIESYIKQFFFSD